MTETATSTHAAPVDAVLLDAGGVLLLPAAEALRERFATHGVEVGEEQLARAHYAGASALDREAGEAGVGRWPTYLSAYATACGVPRERLADVVAELRADGFPEWTSTVPGAAAQLCTLAETGATLVVVSNSNGTVARLLGQAELCQVGPGTGVAVRDILDSHVVGIDKPDPRIFGLGLDAAGCPAERAVMVGDLAHIDVRGAVASGIRAVHLDPYGDCAVPHPGIHARGLADVAGLVRASRGDR